jgi:fatty-acyl-CoA synthase
MRIDTAALRRQTLADLLRRTAARLPAKTAIQCGDTRWSYAEFDTIVDRAAAGLAAEGLGRGDRIAILARNSHAFAAIRFAVARLGAVLVPVNFMLNAEDCAYILRHSGARVLCVDTAMEPVGRAAAALDTRIERLLWLPSEQPTAAPPDLMDFTALLAATGPVPDGPADDRELAQIVYTSGTESKPKGAMLGHDAVIAQYVSCIVDLEVAERDVALHALPLFHCAALDAFMGPSLYVGGVNVITARSTPEDLLAALAGHGITSFFAPPTVWIALLRSPAFDRTDLSRLEKGYYGASIMPVEVLREIQRRLPRLRLWNVYGQTEIAPVATVLKPEDQLRRAGSAGRPVLNVETRVVDDDGRPVVPGQVGEIVHRSPQLLGGYFNDPERTAQAFAGGWFHSGDLATVDDDGYITVVDRRKDMIKTGGENVASREVEEAIYRHAAVAEVAVIGVPHPRWIEAVTAVVVVKSGAALTEPELLAHCRGHLSSYKVPKAVVFTSRLPKNPSGKLLKRELRLQYAASGPQD